jgi:hypothetical protein
MLQVQTYLRGGKALEDLTTELGIKVQRHDTLPLAILNYDQIESPKTHPIVRECRGLVIRSDNYDLVARGFARFFNWGEVADELGLFDFSDFAVHTKEDGSLVLLYFFDGNWMANTRGSFSQLKLEPHDFTWQEAFCKALKITSLQELKGRLDESLTYVCEFCSPFNKIVRRYPDPVMYLLTAFKGEQELPYKTVDTLVGDLFLRPARYEFTSIEGIQDFLNGQAETDPTYEGVVICDKDGRRWKIKSATYLGLHRLKGEGDNLFHPKHLIPFILAGEDTELLTYFPEVEETYQKCKKEVQEAYTVLEGVWRASQGIESQKDYALAIMGKTPFTGLLFTLRKEHGSVQKLEDLKRAWRNGADAILKHVFRR